MLKSKPQSGRNVKDNQELSDRRLKYFIQMLDVKEENNMTRVYSAIHKSEFFFPLKSGKRT